MISIVLIIGTLVVFKQFNFVINKDLGFDKDRVINFKFYRNKAIRNNKNVFKELLLKNPDISAISFSQGYPGSIYNWEGLSYKGRKHGAAIFTVDPLFIDLYGLRIIKGRAFSSILKTDEFNTCILNEAAVSKFGIESPVGKILDNPSNGGSSFPVKKIKIIGVVKDFHFQSLHQKIRPLILGWNDTLFWNASVKISARDIKGTIEFIKNNWMKYSPEFPFSYSFLDETFDKQYNDDKSFGELFGYFSVLGVFIACLGLFGIASFMISSRAREISIRKTLGASQKKIMSLISGDFIKWILISNGIAWPIAFIIMNKWLQNFAYRVGMGTLVFISAGIITLLIATITVSYLTIKAARANPIECLRKK